VVETYQDEKFENRGIRDKATAARATPRKGLHPLVFFKAVMTSVPGDLCELLIHILDEKKPYGTFVAMLMA
jgi:hypothetical protein